MRSAGPVWRGWCRHPRRRLGRRRGDRQHAFWGPPLNGTRKPPTLRALPDRDGNAPGSRAVARARTRGRRSLGSVPNHAPLSAAAPGPRQRSVRSTAVLKKVGGVAVLTCTVLSACAGQQPQLVGPRPDDPPSATTGTAKPGSATGSSASAPTTTQSDHLLPSSSTSTPPTPPAVPPSGFFDGGRPPQFVLFSFDGAADPSLMERWRRTAESSGARLTFFLSAVYLLAKEHRAAYQGPGHPAGASAIGFSPTPGGQDDNTYIAEVVRSLQGAARAGHEIGDHYGGHWCGTGGVSTWTRSDWASELNQVEALVLKVDSNNSLSPPVGPPYDPIRVAGSRTPCLEGQMDELYPVLKARGYRYDASNTKGLFDWPSKRRGLWAFGFAGITIAGLERPTIPVDYSVSTGFGGDAVRGSLSSEQQSQIHIAVRDAYVRTFEQLYYGARTPLEISNHFNTSDGDAYNKAVEDTMRTVCGRPEVVCTTYSAVADWLDAHADALPALAAGKFAKLTR